MYRRTKSLEAILEIRQQMARDADHDVDLFVEMVRSGSFPTEDLPVDAVETDQEESESKAA